ncbi:membrane protein [Sphaerisporangium krabiense]|uniref:Drug/metabolite transporter (DMT)-like permease n=1 Tax=Sphaerisporangium krabiense TaxID=763782 RepID=A0A7W8Z1F5_9ACTN|nr:DMT family transporter [Sphaerisporangium krabiense]MBB5625646.1 drug/metabolite transporter (DMT)-like permease [Sphaerisporangium krabiense]GII63018.1 membrane protein [Sphaerisporangium krabiense]
MSIVDDRSAETGNRRVAELGLVGVAVCFGFTFTMVQDAIRDTPPWTFNAFRFLLAAAVLLIPYGARLRRLPAAGWRAGLVLGLLLTAGYAFQTIGLGHTTVSNAGFITGLYVVLTPVLAWLVLRQAISAWVWGCIALAAFGLFLLSGFGGAWHPLGDALTLLCSLAFAAHIIATDRVIRRFPVGPLVTVQLAVVGLVSLGASTVTGDLAPPASTDVWWAIAFTAIVASAIAYFIQSYAQRRTSPVRASLILATEPAFAGVFGFWLAGDRPTPLGWTGAALMLLAVLLAEARRPADPPQHVSHTPTPDAQTRS